MLMQQVRAFSWQGCGLRSGCVGRSVLLWLLLCVVGGGAGWAQSARLSKVVRPPQPLPYAPPSGKQDPAEDILIEGLGFARLSLQLEVLPSKKVLAARAQQDFVKFQDLLKRNLCWSGLFNLAKSSIAKSSIAKSSIAKSSIAKSSIAKSSRRYCPVKQSLRVDMYMKLSTDGKLVRVQVFDAGPEGLLLFERGFHLKQGLRELTVMELVNQLAKRLTGTRGMLGSTIVFAMKQTGRKTVIAATDTHGTRPQIISRNKNISILPRLTPDTHAIIYTVLSLKGSRIYYQKLAGTGRRSGYLTDFGSLNTGGSFSRNGKRLAFTMSMDENIDLFFLNLYKKKISKPHRVTQREGIEIQPDWSPDGSQLVYISDRSGGPQVYVLNLKTRRELRLSFDSIYNTDPKWSPDGQNILFTRREKGVDQIYIMDDFGQNLRAVTKGAYNCEQAEWSPDGRQIVFASRRSGEFKLYVVAIDGSGLRRLTNTAKDIEENSPSWGRLRLF